MRYTGGAPTSADLVTLSAQLLTEYVAAFNPFLNSAFLLQGCALEDLTGPTGARGSNSTSSGGTSGIGQGLPANIAMAVSWQINRRYRGGHPRTYLVGFSDPQTTGTTSWDPTVAGAVRTAAAEFIDDVNALTIASTGGTITLGVVHYKANKVVLTPPTFDPFQGAQVHPRIDSQRRRLGKERP
jgi:hypothetical protein